MTFQEVTLLAIILVGITAREDCKYSKFTPDHTFCKKRNPYCKVVSAGLDDQDKALLVKLHNDYRSTIALGKESRGGGMPQAANMLEMVRFCRFYFLSLLLHFII